MAGVDFKAIADGKWNRNYKLSKYTANRVHRFIQKIHFINHVFGIESRKYTIKYLK